MKNLLYIIAGLLIIIWIVVFKPSSGIHLLLALAALIVFVRVVFDKRLSNNLWRKQNKSPKINL